MSVRSFFDANVLVYQQRRNDGHRGEKQREAAAADQPGGGDGGQQQQPDSALDPATRVAEHRQEHDIAAHLQAQLPFEARGARPDRRETCQAEQQDRQPEAGGGGSDEYRRNGKGESEESDFSGRIHTQSAF